MGIIDRYIFRRFLANFVVLLLLLFVFAVSIDLLLEIDEYIDPARERVGPDAGFFAETWALIGIVIDFHGPRIFQFYAYMVGLLSVGAMGFTFAQMHRHKELTAVIASGVRLQRIALPIILAALGLNALQLVNQELILPKIAPMLIRKHGDIGRENVKAFSVPFTVDSKGSLLQAPWYEPQTRTLSRPTILERDEIGRTVRRITADEAVWDEDDESWTLKNGRAITSEMSTSRDMRVGAAVEHYRTDLTPQVLTMRQYREFATMLSLAQIREMLRTPGVVNAETLERFAIARFTTLAINILVLLMTLPYFLLREPVSLLRNSMLCAATAIPAMMGALLAVAMDLPGIPATVEVFLPVVMLVPVAMYMLSTVKT